MNEFVSGKGSGVTTSARGAVAMAGLAVLTAISYRLDFRSALLYLIVVVFVALTGDFVASAIVSFVAFLCLTYFLTRTPFTRRRVVVRSTAEYRDGDVWAILAVEDAGGGFRELDEARLFEAFYTTKPGGLGMGLSISRSIVERHGGQLWGTSNSDRGATFQLALPGTP